MQTFTSLAEEWRAVPGFPDYEVSNMGNVRSLDRYRPYRNGQMRLVRGQAIRPHINKRRGGYVYITLSDKARHYTLKLHRIVAEAFIPNPYKKPVVNHKDFDVTNNAVENLEWATHKENSEWTVLYDRQARPHERALIAKNKATGEEIFFKSAKEAERHGFNRASIWRAMTGEYSHHKGYVWEYANYGENN